MCAISGIVKFGGVVSDEELRIMNNAMIQRGPDDCGYYIDNAIGLGHRRLSIIDIENGKQPMQVDGGNCIIVYNGETYNFQEIRCELQKNGVVFTTTSDTEVVLQAYCKWGIKGCLDRMDGMWAFAIYDKKLQKLFLARDRFGEKPLYYKVNKDELSFASELKAFSSSSKKYEIDKTALNLFLSLSYIPAPYTIYEGIHKMMPGHYFEIDLKDGKYSDITYYDVVSERQNLISSEHDAVMSIRDILSDSIKKRMISDVPMGAFLSGGIDSSIVCCLMSKLSDGPINTFSIGYKEKDYDESKRAQIIADHIKSNHTKYILDYSDVLDILEDIILYYDEPYGDSSAIPSYYVAKLAKEKVSVVLTGDCADELFGGYDKYLADYYVKKYSAFPKVIRTFIESFVNKCPVTAFTNTFLRKAKKVIRNAQLSGFDLYYSMMCLGFDDDSRKNLLENESYVDIKRIYWNMWNSIPDDFSYLLKQQMMDVKGVLEGDMFPKVDRACMHVSLENRAPFIDKRIFHIAMNLSDNLKINGKDKKYLLKKAFSDILPKETLKFSKSGFGVPIDYWFRNELKADLLNVLDKEILEKQNLFNCDYVKKILDDHMACKENNRFLLWNLYVFQKWYMKIYNVNN